MLRQMLDKALLNMHQLLSTDDNINSCSLFLLAPDGEVITGHRSLEFPVLGLNRVVHRYKHLQTELLRLKLL